MVSAAKEASHVFEPHPRHKARETAAAGLARFVLFSRQPMSVSKDPRPPLSDSAPDGAAPDGADKVVFRAEPKAPPPIEPHWESVIAAATD